MKNEFETENELETMAEDFSGRVFHKITTREINKFINDKLVGIESDDPIEAVVVTATLTPEYAPLLLVMSANAMQSTDEPTKSSGIMTDPARVHLKEPVYRAIASYMFTEDDRDEFFTRTNLELLRIGNDPTQSMRIENRTHPFIRVIDETPFCGVILHTEKVFRDMLMERDGGLATGEFDLVCEGFQNDDSQDGDKPCDTTYSMRSISELSASRFWDKVLDGLLAETGE